MIQTLWLTDFRVKAKSRKDDCSIFLTGWQGSWNWLLKDPWSFSFYFSQAILCKLLFVFWSFRRQWSFHRALEWFFLRLIWLSSADKAWAFSWIPWLTHQCSGCRILFKIVPLMGNCEARWSWAKCKALWCCSELVFRSTRFFCNMAKGTKFLLYWIFCFWVDEPHLRLYAGMVSF